MQRQRNFLFTWLRRLIWMGIGILILFLSWIVTAFPVGAVEAQVVFQDDFSQGLEKWQPVRDDGSRWTIQNGVLQAEVRPPFTITELVPKDQYWDPSWKNIELSLLLKPLAGVDRNLSFGWIDTQSWYEIHFNHESFQVVHVKNNKVVWSSGYPFTMVNGQQYQLKITFENGLVEFWINDQKKFSERDHYHYVERPGKIGLKTTTGAVYPTQILFDDVVVKLLPSQTGIKLPITPFKQVDLLWKNDEYDSATSWSDQPTIGRWGCALSSLAMIMKFYGLHTLPEGQALTPASLNAWLKSQPDGYIGTGAINWLAGTRLTRLLSEQNGTPKLEYKRHNGSGTEVARQELEKYQPVIFEIPGHFLVGNGLTANKSDFYITDPAYAFSLFTQHKVAPLSTRTFQPSFTDLSYFLVTHTPGLIVELRDGSGNNVPNFEAFEEVIVDHHDQSGELTPPLIQHHIAKPSSGQYSLYFSSQQPQSHELQVLLYDHQANSTLFKKTSLVTSSPETITFQFQKEGVSTVTETHSWTQWRAALKELHTQKLITKAHTFNTLDRLAAAAAAAPLSQQPRHLERLQQTLEQFQPTLTSLAYQYLSQELLELKLLLLPSTP